MSDNKSNPPRLALWLLRHGRRLGDKDALTGDLLERFHEGQTHGWFWRQVLIALAVGILGEIRNHWPHFCYAVAGTAMPLFLWNSFRGVPVQLHWWVLPWPWSQLVLEVSGTAILTWAELPILGIGLAIDGEFRWLSLLRTGAINLVIISLGNYMIDAFPWLVRPVPGNPYLNVLIIPEVFQILLVYSTFLVAAWIGCIPVRDSRVRAGSTP